MFSPPLYIIKRERNVELLNGIGHRRPFGAIEVNTGIATLFIYKLESKDIDLIKHRVLQSLNTWCFISHALCLRNLLNMTSAE